MTATRLAVWGMSGSGNCYKIRLLLAQLQRDYHWHEVDVLGGATRSAAFLRMNPNGKVPLLQIGDDRFLPESNAILCYLADATPLLEGDAWQRAQVLRWLFFEQYSHEPAIAVARFIRKFLGPDDPRQAELAALHERGYAALDVMEQHLTTHDYFGHCYGIADIALHAYTHVAADGGFELENYRATQAWLARVAAQPGYLPMADF